VRESNGIGNDREGKGRGERREEGGERREEEEPSPFQIDRECQRLRNEV